MMTGIYAILAGEALAFRSPWLAAWAAAFIVAMSSHIVFREEPTLRQRFGEAYVRYCAPVPRWVPRVKPYHPGCNDASRHESRR
jgi:protein-S-isoprenylcysteine O-methyltransferase Ste14